MQPKASITPKAKPASDKPFRPNLQSDLRPVGQFRLALFTNYTMDVLRSKLDTLRSLR